MKAAICTRYGPPEVLQIREVDDPVVGRKWARGFAAASVVVASATGCAGDYNTGSAPTQPQHVLRVQANGAGSGMVTAPDASPQLICTITGGALSGVCAAAYPSNSAVQLVATPNGASTFAGWSGACTGTGDCVVDMSQERTVTASFTAPRVVSSRIGPPRSQTRRTP